MTDEFTRVSSRRPLVPPDVRRAEDRRPRRGSKSRAIPGFRPPPPDQRQWRNVQALLGVILLLGVALAAGVTAFETVHDLLRTGDRVVDDYAEGRTGVKFSSTSGRFSAVFPAQPEQSSEAVAGSTERLSDQAIVSVGGADFSISWFDLDSVPDDPGAVLEFLGTALARDRQATIGDRGTLQSSAPQHDFVLALGNDRTTLVRHLIAGRRVFQVEVSSKEALDEAFTRFANSVEPDDA